MPIKPGNKAAGGDERHDPRSAKKGKAGDRVVAVDCDTNLAATWPEMYKHAKDQCEGDEKIGCVIVQLIAPKAKEGRWIDYSKARGGGHEITVNTGCDVKKIDDVHIEHITILNTGGDNTEYRHYWGCWWVCQ